jgi:hypothetical protein
MIDFLIWFILVLLVFGLLLWVIDIIPGLPPQIKVIARVLVAVALILVFLNAIAPGGLMRFPLWRS